MKIEVDHGPSKHRTPESREAEAKKILESRPQREHTPKGQPRVTPVVLSPAERVAASKPKAKKVIAEATVAEPKAE